MELLRALPSPALLGVVHLAPLPGAPRHAGDMSALLAAAARDAEAYAAGGAHGLVVENFGDVPFYASAVPPETIAALALAVARVRATVPHLPVGVNVLRNDARAALGIAAATGAAFVRVNVHTGVMSTDQGLIEGRAAETLRERARLAPGVAILADVHVKHAVPLGGERLVDAAEDAWKRGLADALVLTGRATGSAPEAEVVHEVRAALGARAPLFLGSGVSAENAAALLAEADGAIVGTALKERGDVHAPVAEDRVRALALVFARLAAAPGRRQRAGS
jgi:membrane complex biogenesis BtpA family protein